MYGILILKQKKRIDILKTNLIYVKLIKAAGFWMQNIINTIHIKAEKTCIWQHKVEMKRVKELQVKRIWRKPGIILEQYSSYKRIINIIIEMIFKNGLTHASIVIQAWKICQEY